MLSYTEIEIKKKYDKHGIMLVKGKERLSVLNNYERDLYIDLSSFANALDISLNKLLEDVSYDPLIRGYLGFFREGNRTFKVVNLECLNSLIRGLASSGYNIELLRTVKQQINTTVEELQKEVVR